MSKILRNFWQLSSLIVNISGTDPCITNPKSIISTTTPSTLGELWSTNKNVLIAHIDLPKRTFLGRLRFGPWGLLPPQIFTRIADWPNLASAHHNWDGGPPKKFNRENLKFGLKFSVWATKTLGLIGVSSQNLFQATCREVGVIKWP